MCMTVENWQRKDILCIPTFEEIVSNRPANVDLGRNVWAKAGRNVW